MHGIAVSAIDRRLKREARRIFDRCGANGDAPGKFACADLGLALETASAKSPLGTVVEAVLSDERKCDRAISLFFEIPVCKKGLVWHDDIRRSRKASGLKPLENSHPSLSGSGFISVYPMGSVTGSTGEDGEKKTISIAIDPRFPSEFRISYDPGRQSLNLSYDIALSGDTANFPHSARFRFAYFESDAALGFRGAWQRFMDIFPGPFFTREKIQGNWLPFAKAQNIEGFGDFAFRFHELHGLGEAFDAENAIAPYNYTEPFTWWMSMDPDTPRTYDAALEMVKNILADPEGSPYRKRRAAALLNSGIKDEKGKYAVEFLKYPWCDGACWTMNPNPWQEGEINGATVNWPKDAMQSRHGALSLLRGEYIDSTEGYTTPELNYDRNAFKYETRPLSYDPKTKEPAIHKGIAVYEFAKKMSGDLHSIGKSLFGNGLPYRFPWLADAFDIMGTETVWLGEDGTYAPIADSQMALWRTLSGKKPYLLLQNSDFRRFDSTMVKRYMERSLFYALYPSMFSVDAATDPYWENPAYYNRDRGHFKKYMPLIKELGEAGWEVVTLARVYNKNVFAERYSRRYLTLCNDTMETQKTKVKVLFPVGRKAMERIHGKEIAVSAKGTFEVKIGPQSTLMVDFGS